MTLEIHHPAPQFAAPSTQTALRQLSDFKGKRLVLYFYPKDNTPGCTLEGQAFKRLHAKFQKENTEILGVSRDSLKAHEKFSTQECFPFELLSDTTEAVCKAYDVLKLKKNYGKEYIGIERSTFLIDEKGILQQIWRKVTPEGHAEAVLAAVKQL